MTRNSYFLHALNAFALASALHVTSARAQTDVPRCRLAKEARLPLLERSHRFLVEAEINGETRLFVIDSGAERSALAPDVADALALPVDHASAQKLNGVGEVMASQYPRVVRSLKFGPAQWTDLKLPTADQKSFAPFADQNPAGILGADVLSRYDVELDFPAHTITLYTAQNCLGHFVPWTGSYQAYTPEYTGRHLFLMDIALDGHGARAILDTGAGASLVGSGAAARSGVDDSDLARDRAGSGKGVAGSSFRTWVHRFGTIQVGTRVFRDANMLVGDTSFSRGVDMLLGMDFMRRRRVWLSYSTGWVFMQLDRAQAGASQAPAAPADRASLEPIDEAGQLGSIATSGVAWSGLPDGPIPQFSSHSHITYRTIPHVVQASRLSPLALPEGSTPGQ